MLINLNKAIVFFFTICFIAMAIPYIVNLGEQNVFIYDYYAKRIMTLFLFPFFIGVLYIVLNKKKVRIHKNGVLYLLLYVLVLIISFIKGNRIVLIFTDAFIAFLPVFFYLLVYKTDITIEAYKKNFLWFLSLASILVVFNVKLQFSYFSLIAIVYILFYAEFRLKNVLAFILLPIITIKSLIGKSALLMLIFLISYFFIFDTENVSRKKKIYLLLIPSVLITIGTIVFWDKIQTTGSYKNIVYFLRHADFSSFKFADQSTSHRLYEARIVLQNFSNNNIFTKLFGNGFGSTIDLSGAVDLTISSANSDVHNVRNIHMGIFAVLSRYGVLGVLIYGVFIYKMIIVCIRILQKPNHFSIILGSLYVLLLLFDSLISFPHMMSNFLFWFITFILLYEYKTNFSPKFNSYI
jgi:hypothetical protein